MANTQEPIFHIFSVHSHITYLVSMAIIRQLNLLPEQCVFVLSFAYRLPKKDTKIKSFVLPFPTTDRSQFYQLTWWRARNNMKNYDRFLEQITEGNSFIYYGCGNWLFEFPMAVSHKNCLKYCLIEEGGYMYYHHAYEINCNFKIKTRYSSFLLRLCNDNRLATLNMNHYLTMDHPKFDKFYICDPRGLKEFPNAVILNNVFQDYHNTIFDNADAILILDTTITKDGIRAYLKALEILIEGTFIKNGYKKILLRTKPYRGKSLEKILGEFLRMVTKYPEIQFEEIPSEIIMENVFHSYNIPVYFDMSSLGVYAAIQGRKTFSTMFIRTAFDPIYRNDELVKMFSVENYVGIIRLPAINIDGSPITPAPFTLWHKIRHYTKSFIKTYCPRSIWFVWRGAVAAKNYKSDKKNT